MQYIIGKDIFTGFTFVWQSPEEVKVQDIRTPVILYCVCSLHSIARYKWEKLGEPERKFASTAVLYLAEEGLFTCTAEAGGRMRKSHMIDVSIEPGMYSFRMYGLDNYIIISLFCCCKWQCMVYSYGGNQ